MEWCCAFACTLAPGPLGASSFTTFCSIVKCACSGQQSPGRLPVTIGAGAFPANSQAMGRKPLQMQGVRSRYSSRPGQAGSSGGTVLRGNHCSRWCMGSSSCRGCAFLDELDDLEAVVELHCFLDVAELSGRRVGIARISRSTSTPYDSLNIIVAYGSPNRHYKKLATLGRCVTTRRRPCGRLSLEEKASATRGWTPRHRGISIPARLFNCFRYARGLNLQFGPSKTSEWSSGSVGCIG